MAVVEEASRTSPQSKVEAHRRAIATQKAIIVKFLEANGFRKDVNCKGTEEEQVCYTYPLHVAVKQENAAMVELLLHFGAKAKQKDYKGKTACDYAKSAPEILKIFELYGDATKPWDAYFARLQQHPCLVAPRKATRFSVTGFLRILDKIEPRLVMALKVLVIMLGLGWGIWGMESPEEVVKEELLEDPYMVDEEPGATAEQHTVMTLMQIVARQGQLNATGREVLNLIHALSSPLEFILHDGVA
ncbi:Mitotic checkpoint protein BUB3.2 [Durusdinium trenchii]|uniref:Mitotic checkpoint protein BUB3.2 n=1 Tax=Durusdinium trenchii TaxID=1381693 RepID=A0ABP0KK39_9DINO